MWAGWKVRPLQGRIGPAGAAPGDCRLVKTPQGVFHFFGPNVVTAMRKLHFYSLPRSLQDRFIESARGAAVPAPLLVRRIRNRDHLIWLGAGAGVAAAWALFVGYGFGDLDHSLALTSPGWLAMHAAFAAAVIACLLRGHAVRWEAQRTPYPEGAYLFPAVLIEARRGDLIEHDLSKATDVSVQGSHLRIAVNGNGFTFEAASPELAERGRTTVEASREQWARLQKEDSALEKARLSPLVDSGVPNPLAPTTPLASQRFLKPVAFALLTVISAAMLSWAVWWWRNELSEKSLYAAAAAQNSVEAYQAYLARGGKRPEVVDVLLPRARLAVAREVGTIDAIRQYIADHPESKIGGEVQAALRAAVLAALEQAKAVGSVTALAEFAAKYPDHVLVSAELAAARRAVYQRTLAAFEKQAAPKNDEIVPFVQRLLAYAEKHGPRVDVRMEHRFPQKIETIDNILAKSPKYYMGRRSLPTQYFLGDYAARRERTLAERLIQRLQTNFPKDVLEFRFVGPSDGINPTLPAIEVPTLTLTHTENLSGGFVGGRPKTIFVGASIAMTATFEIPGEKEPYVFKWGKWAPPNIRKIDDSDKTVPDVIPDAYEEMMSGSFEKFGEDYLKQWYAEP